MSKQSTGPVKGDKKFFEKVKQTVNNVWANDLPAAANAAPTKGDETVKIKDITVAAKKQVIAAKARSVKKTTLTGNNPASAPATKKTKSK